MRRFTPPGDDIDSLIEPILVAHGKRHDIELQQIPESFYPFSGKNKTRDLHKILFDDESYNKGHGHLYEYLGIDPQQGVIIIVRPDQCKQITFLAAIISLMMSRCLCRVWRGQV